MSKEIDRLKAQNLELTEERDAVIFTYNQADRECAILRKLCAQAADALEDEFGSPDNPAYGVKGPVHQLIISLRKAAAQ